MKYKYDDSMDEAYQRSLVTKFKKTVDDDLDNFIIVDMINNKISKIEEMEHHEERLEHRRKEIFE
jgi:CRISPR/Cas system-associated endoribonuclease Cas2